MGLVGDERREMTIKGRKRCATNRKLKNQKQKQATRVANNYLKREMILHEKIIHGYKESLGQEQ